MTELPPLEGVVFGDAPSESTDGEGRKRWYIADDRQAAWVAGKYLAERDRLDELKAKRDGFLADVAAWFELASAPVEADAERWKTLLDIYALQVREHTGAMSFKLPNAVVATTKTEAYPKVADADVVLHWLHMLPLHLAAPAIKESVAAAGFKKLCEVVELFSSAVLSCGCVVEFEPPRPAADLVMCPSCTEPSEPVEWRGGALSVARAGQPVPGAVVEPEKISVQVRHPK